MGATQATAVVTQELTQDYGVLKYTLPSGAAEQYAQRAIAVLDSLPFDELPYLLRADVVLTLSGVRALDAYISFPGLDLAGIARITRRLAAHGLTLFSEGDEYTGPSDGFFLVHHQAMQGLHQQYGLQGWFNPRPPYTMERLMVWAYLVEGILRGHMDRGTLPKEWLRDYQLPHDIWFGILLGYPGEAIASMCWLGALHERAGSLIPQAVIAYHDAYEAAWPVYGFTKDAMDNANVRAHQALWSAILTGVYESDWHQELKQDEEFVQVAATVQQRQQDED